jgi:hypothetical protein
MNTSQTSTTSSQGCVPSILATIQSVIEGVGEYNIYNIELTCF